MRRHTSPDWRCLTAAALVCCVLQAPFARGQDDGAAGEALKAAVEADWDRQEKGKDRGSDDPAAITEALERAAALLEHLRDTAGGIDPAVEAGAIERLKDRADELGSLGEGERLALYREIRWQTRKLSMRTIRHLQFM